MTADDFSDFQRVPDPMREGVGVGGMQTPARPPAAAVQAAPPPSHGTTDDFSDFQRVPDPMASGSGPSAPPQQQASAPTAPPTAPPTTAPSAPSGNNSTFAAGANKAIAGALGLPVDAMTGGLNLGIRGLNAVSGMNVPQIQDPLGGSRSIEKGMTYLGVPDPESVHPQNLLGHVGEAAGGAVAGGVMTGGLGGMLRAVAPGLAAEMPQLFKPMGGGAGVLSNVGTAARNTVASAALGGASAGALTPGNMQERADQVPMGAAAGAALGGLSGIAGGIGLGRLGENGRNASVGRTLSNELPGGTASIEAPGIPGAPLEMGQATGSPQMARRADLVTSGSVPGLSGSSAAKIAEQAAALKAGQPQAILGHLGQIGDTNQVPTEAATPLINTIRQAQAAAVGQERQLWNAPELNQAPLTIAPVVQSVDAALKGLGQGLQYQMTPEIQKAIDGLNGMASSGAPVMMRDLNPIRSDLLKIQRGGGGDGHIAGVLQEALMDGLNQVPEINANPAIRGAYDQARGYTAEMRQLMADPHLQSALSTNRGGAYVNDASQAAKRLLPVTGAPEGAQSLSQLSGLMQKIGQPGVADDVKQNARDYLVSSMIQGTKLSEPTNFRPMAMVRFLQQNAKTIQQSGLFTRDQVNLFGEVEKYADQLSRTGQLNNMAGNSATAGRLAAGKTYVDGIMAPWVTKLMENTSHIAGVGGFAHSGPVGAVVGYAGGQALKMLGQRVAGAENALRETMSAAVLDPNLARDLMQPFNGRTLNRLGDNSLNFLGRMSRMAATEGAALAASPGTQGAQGASP